MVVCVYYLYRLLLHKEDLLILQHDSMLLFRYHDLCHLSHPIFFLIESTCVTIILVHAQTHGFFGREDNYREARESMWQVSSMCIWVYFQRMEGSLVFCSIISASFHVRESVCVTYMVFRLLNSAQPLCDTTTERLILATILTSCSRQQSSVKGILIWTACSRERLPSIYSILKKHALVFGWQPSDGCVCCNILVSALSFCNCVYFGRLFLKLTVSALSQARNSFCSLHACSMHVYKSWKLAINCWDAHIQVFGFAWLIVITTWRIPVFTLLWAISVFHTVQSLLNNLFTSHHL